MNNEPNFEGEEMKLPVQNITIEESPVDTQTKGTLIVVLFAALAVILAGMFYWYKITSVVIIEDTVPARPTTDTNKEPETTTATAQVQSFSALSTSNELNAIEADLESTNLDSLESELPQIDTELETAVE